MGNKNRSHQILYLDRRMGLKELLGVRRKCFKLNVVIKGKDKDKDKSRNKNKRKNNNNLKENSR